MPSVCLYFQVHQPYRLRRYSVFDSGSNYFDEYRNTQILQKIAGKCYLPATRILLDQVQKHNGKFKLAFSVTGCVIEQFKNHSPEMIKLLQQLARTGCVEFLSETYHHSLASLYSRDEFAAQLELHRTLIQELFGQTPAVFRNTELIYSNDLGTSVAAMGCYKGALAEGVDSILGYRTPNDVYNVKDAKKLKLLLKNYRMSDDIAFRFSNRSWPEWPLTADKFAGWVSKIHGHGSVCNLFMDFETFGEHQWAETGILDFLAAMPGEILHSGAGVNHFSTPSEIFDKLDSVGEFDAPSSISWADTERDLSAWVGNAMQSNALIELYKLEGPIKAANDPKLLEDWRKLTTSDHFYYMCTKYFADGDVHKYFNPYQSPYDSYINFMNVLDHLRTRAER